MTIYELPNANASVIAVTNTATGLFALINTAGGTSVTFPSNITGVDLYAEDGDIRYLFDGNTPTTTKGILLKRGERAHLRNKDISKLRLIRTGSSNVAVSVAIGTAANDESDSFSNPEVGLNTAIQAYNAVAGANESNVGVNFFRPSDALQAEYEGASNTTPQQVIAGTVSKYIDIHQITISTDTAQWIRLEDNTGTPVVVIPKKYLPANGTLTIVYPMLRRVNPAATGKNLMVDCGGSSGNISIEVLYRSVSA